MDADTIYGGVGDDYINAGQGTDVVYGEAGNDSMFAADLDSYFSGSGNQLYGGEGDDYMLASKAGADTLSGGNGNDVVMGDIYGISPGNSRNSLSGDDGNDYVVASSYGDDLNGGAGVDVMWRYSPGGAAASAFMSDVMNGGTGGDYFFLSNASERLIFNGGQVAAGDVDYVYSALGAADRVEIASGLSTGRSVVAYGGGALLTANATGGGQWYVWFLNDTVANVNSHLYII
jgi:Ca2+-binding RTX toxin-like protein